MPEVRAADRLALLRRRIEEIERAPGGVPKPRTREGGGTAAAPALPQGAGRGGAGVADGGAEVVGERGGTVTRGANRTIGTRAPLALGAAAVDAALGGGLARAALHEVAAARGGDPAAALGFSLGVAARAAAAGRVLWVLEGAAAGEAGTLYGPGLEGYGLPARRLVVVAVRRPVEALWAMEEGLRTPGLAAVVAELLDGAPADLTASRRLSLAARAGGGLGLLVLHRPAPGPSAAVTRWRAAAAAGPPDRHGGLGPPAATLALTRNRRGPCGTFTIEWDSHAGRFADLPAPRTLAGRAGDAGHRGGPGGEPRADGSGEAGAGGRLAAAGAAGPHAGGVAAAAGDRPPRPQAA